MAIRPDRLGDILEGAKRRRRTIVTPEGVELDIRLAGSGERLTAFLLDLLFMFATVFVLYFLLVLLFFTDASISLGMTVILFAAFVVRNLYFLHFELAWQGRTPGKRICGLRVINRRGGELSPSAVIARNLTREVEFFLPLSLMLSVYGRPGSLQMFALTGWILIIALLPLFNRDRLRAGDIIAGTQVIAMPKRVLSGDLAATPQKAIKRTAYAFTHAQLSIYGTFELQVLEEFLRRPPSAETQRQLEEICGKIRRKIGWEQEVPPGEVRNFLTEFYTAERATLERGQLFGKRRDDKNSPPA